MGMNVDEARGNESAMGFDDLSGLYRPAGRRNGRDNPACDQDILMWQGSSRMRIKDYSILYSEVARLRACLNGYECQGQNP
jgi:hypothetical protein